MANKTKHIIQSQSVEINFSHVEVAMGMQNRIAEVFYERLLPQMETLFDEMADENHIIAVEKLEIDCGVLSAKNWEGEWVENALRKLKAELLTLDKRRIDKSSIAKSFFFFLQHGHLPWNSNIQSIPVLEKEIISDHHFLEQLKQTLQESGIATRRLLQQFSASFLKKITVAILEYGVELDDQTLYPGEYFSLTNKPATREAILKVFAGKKETAAKENQETGDKIKRTQEEKSRNDKPDEIYISNAGLIILHPFLPRLFELLQFTKDHQWINEEAQQTAALVSEFLVTGTEEFPEFNLPLNKVLCGIALDDTLKSDTSIDEKTRLACEELLVEVIGHWSALKNTGIDAFRETFLRRNGKLTKMNNGWLLQVEQKAVDVLLGSLPWGIGTIKLPWMPEILFTEWA